MDTLSQHTKPERLRWGIDRRSSYEPDRIRAIRWEGQIRKVSCPTCLAPVAEDCHSVNWRATQFHVARVRAAEAAE